MVAVMLLALWLALLCVLRRLGGRRRYLLAGALFVAATAAIFLSNHDSSKVGLVASLVVFALAIPWPAGTRKVLWLVWCLAFALVVPLATAAYKADLHKSEHLPLSAQARGTLWAYTAEHVRQSDSRHRRLFHAQDRSVTGKSADAVEEEDQDGGLRLARRGSRP
jgi:hypothetical protein